MEYTLWRTDANIFNNLIVWVKTLYCPPSLIKDLKKDSRYLPNKRIYRLENFKHRRTETIATFD